VADSSEWTTSDKLSAASLIVSSSLFLLTLLLLHYGPPGSFIRRVAAAAATAAASNSIVAPQNVKPVSIDLPPPSPGTAEEMIALTSGQKQRGDERPQTATRKYGTPETEHKEISSGEAVRIHTV
jgi:hypothetical protein